MDLKICKMKTDKDDVEIPDIQKNYTIPAWNTGACLVCGSVKSGKTNLLSVLATDKRFYGDFFDSKNIFLFSPTAEYDTMSNNIKVPKQNRISDNMINKLEELTKSQISNIKAKKHKKLLIIFDDLTSCRKLMNSSIFKKVFTCCRHIHMMVFVAVHTYKSLTRLCRMQCSYVIFFRANDSEYEALAEDYTPHGRNKKYMYKLFGRFRMDL